jgi:hypothetical protein
VLRNGPSANRRLIGSSEKDRPKSKAEENIKKGKPRPAKQQSNSQGKRKKNANKSDNAS